MDSARFPFLRRVDGEQDGTSVRDWGSVYSCDPGCGHGSERKVYPPVNFSQVRPSDAVLPHFGFGFRSPVQQSWLAAIVDPRGEAHRLRFSGSPPCKTPGHGLLSPSSGHFVYKFRPTEALYRAGAIARFIAGFRHLPTATIDANRLPHVPVSLDADVVQSGDHVAAVHSCIARHRLSDPGRVGIGVNDRAFVASATVCSGTPCAQLNL